MNREFDQYEGSLCREWLLLMLLGLLVNSGSIAQSASGDEDARPNILFIAIDDLRPELGCYGVESVKSPQIDKLAQSSVLFERAYCQVAVCNPSRVSVMTGLRPDTTKVWDLVTRFRETMPNAVTLPQHFKQHGYYAASFGKIFHNPWPDNQSWSEPHAWPKNSSLWSDDAKQRLADYREEMQQAGESAVKIGRMRAQATEAVDVADEEHIDGAIAEQAIAKMRMLATQKQPFFLAAGFVRPHLPFVVPRKYWDLYDRSMIPDAVNQFLPKDSPAFAMNTMYELRDYFDFAKTADPKSGSLTKEQRRRLKHGYYASISFIDALIGKLLSELDALGLSDKTVVVLWSDHGWKLGEHNSWCKQSNYEIDARVPFLIRAPRAPANGQRVTTPVELLDIYPTLCDLAGLPVPEEVEGRSLVSLLNGSSQEDRAAYNQFRRNNGQIPLMGYAMKTDRYRYIEWQNRRTGKVVTTELYDHTVDPDENVNVASAPKSQAVIARLSKQMWDELPPPPKFTKGSTRPRPKVTFRNRSGRPITLFWIKPDGERHRSGEVLPGAETTHDTTIGHRFVAKWADGSEREYVVAKQLQIVTVLKPKKPQQPQPQSSIPPKAARPNIVVCVADDWSWPHASALGDPAVKTPAFDRVAREGVLFERAFVSTPSCTPSRLSILTGQHHWRLQEGDSLGGSLRTEYPVYTDILADAGYRVGRSGKGVWPSQHQFRQRDSFGERFPSFSAFLKARKIDQPFCYWHGGQDPHRPYELGVGARSGVDVEAVRVPASLPDNLIVRGDVADYLWEVERFDREVGAIIRQLEQAGELENTILVVSSDNGMPFPRCKATLYDDGTRVPLAIRWGKELRSTDRSISEPVSLCDLAPTFLEVAGLEIPSDMTGRSLMPLLRGKPVENPRAFVLTGMEQHVYSWPARALRTNDFLYIRNVNPGSWPTGEIDGHNPTFDFAVDPWPTERGAFSFNVDPSPTKQFLRLHRNDPDVKPFADRVFGQRPREELYDLRSDPGQLTNVADDSAYAADLVRLRRKLMAELIKSNDPGVAIPGYTQQSLEGWPVRVGDKLRETDPEGLAVALDLLAEQIRKVKDLLPSHAVAHLQSVPIWLSPRYENRGPTGEYHPGAGWLKDQGRHPELHQAIEFTNVEIFEREVQRMPVLLLHELAHAYHDQVLGFDQPEIKTAYERAQEAGSYEAVKRRDGVVTKAYAMATRMEYFAESSEAYFSINDFFPFNRTELEEHDPEMAKLLGKLWRVEEIDRAGEVEK